MSEQDTSITAFDSQIIFVPVADLARSTAFYEQALLLPPALDQGGIRIFRVVGGGFVGLCQSDRPVAPDDRLILTFVTERVDEWHTRLAAQGVPTDGPPRENERYHIYHFFARDPDGYRIEIQRFLHSFP
jgi:catechol 2,3-dioxygenase-like lactoylglutathione lyase family enzyme